MLFSVTHIYCDCLVRILNWCSCFILWFDKQIEVILTCERALNSGPIHWSCSSFSLNISNLSSKTQPLVQYETWLPPQRRFFKEDFHISYFLVSYWAYYVIGLWLFIIIGLYYLFWKNIIASSFLKIIVYFYNNQIVIQAWRLIRKLCQMNMYTEINCI